MRRIKSLLHIIFEELSGFVFALAVAGVGAYATYHVATNHLAEVARQTFAP